MPGKVLADLRRRLEPLARAHSPAAIRTLASIVLDKKAPPAARIAAANSILDRGLGKPPQGVELSGKDGGPVETMEVTDEARVEAFMAFLARTNAKPDQGDKGRNSQKPKHLIPLLKP